MSYGTFNSITEVAKKFDIEITDTLIFTQQKTLNVPDFLFSMIEKKLTDKMSYVSEYAICETLIRPILDIVVDPYPVKVWSHVAYNVDKKKGLVGEPDYLIASRTKYGEMARPALCVIEAKQENFTGAWTQALAEMVASSLLGAKICYGIVTTGAIWQFGKLDNQTFTIDPNFISATTNLQLLFNTLNWVFDEVSSIK